MSKSADAFRTIREVSEWLDTPAHVLRFWESKFTQIKPMKRAGGRRYYRQADMQLIGGIKTLLHDEGMTIRGVQKLLRDQGVKHVAAMSPQLDFELETPAPEAAPEPKIEVATPEAAPSAVVLFPALNPEGGESPLQKRRAKRRAAREQLEQPSLFAELDEIDDDDDIVEEITPDTPADVSPDTTTQEATAPIHNDVGLLALIGQMETLSQTQATELPSLLEQLGKYADIAAE